MKFHHTGMAVYSIEKTAAFYTDKNLGYTRSQTVYDPVQNVNICWLTKEGEPTIELLEPVDEKSPVVKTLDKNGVSPYHICYVVDDIEAAVKELRLQKFVALGRPVEAVAFRGSKVCFLYSKAAGLIELVEAPAEITE